MEHERVLLGRLAVFEGRWTLHELEAICTAPPIEANAVLDVLCGLVDKSLVLADPQRPSAQYRLLDTTRQYASERLEAVGELQGTRERHLRFHLRLAEEAEPKLRGSRVIETLERLDRAEDNLRAALRWSIESGNTEAELRMVAALWNFWWMRGHIGEGLSRAEDALSRANDSAGPIYARALHAAGTLTGVHGNYDRAECHLARSVSVLRQLGDTVGMIRPLADLGSTQVFRGHVEAGEAMLDESLRLAREAKDPWSIGYTAYALAAIRTILGRFDEARPLFDEAAGLLRQMGDTRGLAYALLELAIGLCASGEPGRADHHAREAIALFLGLGENFGLLGTLVALGACAQAQRQPSRAARLLGGAEAFEDSMGAALLPHWRANFDNARSAARDSLGGQRFDRTWSEGQALSLEQAVQVAQSRGIPTASEKTALSERELQVAKLVARGLSNRGLAAELFISPGTAGLHVKHILHKLGFATRSQVAAWVAQQGLL